MTGCIYRSPSSLDSPFWIEKNKFFFVIQSKDMIGMCGDGDTSYDAIIQYLFFQSPLWD